MKPTTVLPWGDESIKTLADTGLWLEDAKYIVHACNAYPKLVEALKDALVLGKFAPEDYPSFSAALRLLRELGEEK